MTEGTFRYEKMAAMRSDGFTLREIGEAFGLSRERARQILGSGTPRGSMAKRAILRALERNPDLDGWDLAAETDTSIDQVKRYGPQGRFCPRSGYAKTGYATEKLFIEEAKRRWLDARSAEVTAFDVVCGGKRVEVKTGGRCKTTPHVMGDQWRFNLRGKDGKSDFLALYIPDTDDWFIVPTREAMAKKTRDLYIVWPKINPQGAKNFLHRYLNRWDLLQLP